MKKTLEKTRRLLVMVDTRHAASREMIAGVMRFAATQGDWEVQFLDSIQTPVEYFRSWKPDALIADASVHALSKEDFSVLSGRAIVFVNTMPRKNCRKPYARLATDDRALALAAADLFAHKKLTHFAYVGTSSEERWSEARGRLFRATLRDRGHSLNVFPASPAGSWRDQEKTLAAWLDALPKPCGVWAACDQRAKLVIDACRLAGLTIPGQIQVLGVDNEPFVCEQTSPTLSSIAPDFKAGGHAAAVFADQVVSGGSKSLSGTRLAFPVRGTFERLSTDDGSERARHVSVAREFIRCNATSGIGVKDVAAAVGISLRLLQRDYPLVTGTTVIDALIDAKIACAKELLSTSSSPLSQVAKMSGFPNVTHLMTLFHKRVGMTMKVYRASTKK